MSRTIPATITAYLEQLRDALKGADPALIQDALYDAEEHLRSELAENPGVAESDLLARMATTYGIPEEVAALYRDKEEQVAHALHTPRKRAPRSLIGRFFGVAADARSYASLFYMLLSLATGIFYFTFVVTGLSLSLGLSILIIGIPVILLFIGIIRILALVEGRIVEVMLGERMPRRPLYAPAGKGWIARIKHMFVDPRTWSTLLYFLAMLPLGILYFTIAISGFSIFSTLTVAPLFKLLSVTGVLPAHYGSFGIHFGETFINVDGFWLPILFFIGILGLFAMLHLARGIGYVHGQIAKQLLVKAAGA